MKTILDYLTQKSTWLGITGLITAFGIYLKPELIEGIAVAGVAVASLIETLWNDKK